MNLQASPAGAALGGISAYERQTAPESPKTSPILTERKQREFSFGPFTVRYEEEESFNFSALARAAAAQLERVRRFNFSEALQTEAAKEEFLGAAQRSPAASPASAPDFKDASLRELAARTSEALAGLTYDASGRMRAPRVYFPQNFETETPGRETAPKDQSASGTDATASAPFLFDNIGSSAGGAARTRAALAAYLAAGRCATAQIRAGNIVSDAV